MATSIFSKISQSLEEACSFSAPAARGTVRLAVIEGGFRPQSITSQQMARVLEEILPEMLDDRGVRHPGDVCKGLLKTLN